MTNQINFPPESGQPTLNEESDQQQQPQRGWLAMVVLKFLVFLAFAFVLFEVLVGLGKNDLPQSRVWVTIAAMVGLLLLLAIDRLTQLRVSATGLEATLTQMQAQALEEVNMLEDREAVEMARAQILQAKNPAEVEAARTMAIELNVNQVIDRVTEAIQQKRKLYVRYRPDPKGPVETYTCMPLDIKPGKTAATKANDYLWLHSDKHGHVISLRLGKVQGVEMSEETFDPAEVMKTWDKEPEWNLPRDW